MQGGGKIIKVVGGVYFEHCVHPHWKELFGSGGRAASALASLGASVELHSYIGQKEEGILKTRASLESFSVVPNLLPHTVRFDYFYDLASPFVSNRTVTHTPIPVTGEHIVRFGMIEGTAVVSGSMVVYDPQNMGAPESFTANNSSAERLAIILNKYEASLLTGLVDVTPESMAKELIRSQGAEVVVIKMGPLGAFVYHNGNGVRVPAFRTDAVWTIGSGDTFVAHFAYHWFANPDDPVGAAHHASIATSYYCLTQGFPTQDQLSRYSPEAIQVSEAYKNGNRPLVYLAGPFFTLAQRWLVEQTRDNLRSMGLRVFSPVHDVGFGTAEDVVSLDLKGIEECDLVFAIVDGLDAGTVYEVGYARAINKPVIVYCENEKEEDKKMMIGSDCRVYKDYVTAIYQTLWEAVGL